MRRRSATITVLSLTLVLGACSSKHTPPRTDAELAGIPETTVHVFVRGLHSLEGKVWLALFATPDGFPKEVEKAVRRMEAPIEADPVEFMIEGVAPGAYALSILHDENADGEMDSNFFGIPSEGYGFSRDARGRFGPPSFDDAMFEVLGEPVRVEITLTYP